MLKIIAKRLMITAGLETSYAIQRAGLMSRARGRGAIFTLHHVRPFSPGKCPLNRHLEISPEFLDQAIRQLKEDGYRIVPLSQLPELLARPDQGERFAVFTLDDGFRDNLEHALPVFERHQAPFTIFVCKGFSERSHTLWWETLETTLENSTAIEWTQNGNTQLFATATTAESIKAVQAIAPTITKPGEAEAIAQLDALAARHGVDATALCEQLIMGPDDLKTIARHPLCTLGAHTISHRAMGFLPESEVANELSSSADYVEMLTGKRPTTFAYPYGDNRSVTDTTVRLAKEAGFSVAVSTAPGTLSDASLAERYSLPRISLNGYYQKPRYVSALASGIPFKLTG